MTTAEMGAAATPVIGDDLAPEHWQDVDTADVGESATAYLDATAAALGEPRIRSHELLGVQPGATVLDVGCGTGIALREIADLVGPDGTVVGLDPSASMLDQARRRLSGAPAGVELVEGTATETGLDGDRFDAVRTERMLMHVADPLSALTELARVTRPGGRIVLVEPDHRRLAVDTDTPDVMIRIVMGFSTMIPNMSAGLRAPSDATKVGLAVDVVEPVPCVIRSHAQFADVFRLDAGRHAAHAQGVTDAAFDALLDEFVTRDREGRFLAVAMMYVVVVCVG